MNGVTRDTWCALFKPEFQIEAGAIFDMFDAIYNQTTLQPKKCGKRFVSKVQLIILVLAILAFDNLGLPVLMRIFGL